MVTFRDHFAKSAALVVLAIAAACARGSIFGADDVETSRVTGQRMVQVATPVVDYTASTGTLYLNAAVTITNTMAESVYYRPCTEILERRIDSGWIIVWPSLCNLDGITEDDLTEIRPGSEYKTAIQMAGTLGRMNMSEWREPITGEYRLTINFTNRKNTVSSEHRRSEPFEIRVD